jgi:hypothetical protein
VAGSHGVCTLAIFGVFEDSARRWDTGDVANPLLPHCELFRLTNCTPQLIPRAVDMSDRESAL